MGNKVNLAEKHKRMVKTDKQASDNTHNIFELSNNNLSNNES